MWQRRRASHLFFVAFGVVGVAAGSYHPLAPPENQSPPTYSRDILPILSDKCFKCHGPDASSRMADLRLDTPEGAFANRGGTYAIVPKHPEHSLVVKRITSTSMPMPPSSSGKSLTRAEIAAIKEWIAGGATYGKLWSFDSVPKQVPVPTSHSRWPMNDIDKFVLEKLESSHLQPTMPASRNRWLRRVTYDLTGLPPTEQDLKNFLSDKSPNAYEHVVDSLESSHHFGERLAVDWLDAARYSDSYGYQSDLISPTWPYRDWVVKAFNQNLPYNQFLVDQIAGDLLPNASREQRLATAFSRLHRQSNEGGSIPLEYKTEYVADRISTYGTAVLGLTLGCARCHDHKFDPITQREYYQLGGYFTLNEFGLLLSSEIVPPPSLLLPTAEQEKKLNDLKAKSEAAIIDLRNECLRAKPRFSQWLSQLPSDSPKVSLLAKFSFGETKNGKFQNLAGGMGSAERIGMVQFGAGPDPTSQSKAALLDGDNGIVCRGLPGKERWDAFTWSFSIKDPRKGKGPQVLLHRTGGTDVGFCGFDLTLEDGQLTARVMRSAPGNSITVRTLNAFPANKWTQVAWSWNGSGNAMGLQIYVDGKIAPTEILNDRLWKKINAYGDLSSSAGDWCFGQRFRDSGFKGGELANIAFADRVLSSLEIEDLYDHHSLKEAFTKRLANDPLLYEYFLASVDPAIRKAEAEMQQAQQTLANFEEDILEVPVMEQPKRPIPSYLLARGVYDAPRNAKTLVTCGVPKVLPPLSAGNHTNDRLALARWTVRDDNPLTARVAVNRYWQLMFGTGLVESTENFGVQGARPTHPELLDYLARKFINSGWNVKQLLKEIALSATYRQDSTRTSKLNKVDPYNRLLARGPSFRMSAEMLRDTALAASGLLVDQVGGPPVNPYQPAGIWTENNTMTPGFVQSKGPGLYRRSLYSTWKRTTPVPSMLLFDATSREACTVKRPTTNTPLQALVLLNDVQFVEAARVLAQNELRKNAGPESGIQDAFLRLCSREPDTKELAVLSQEYRQQLKSYKADAASASKLVHMGDSVAPEIIPIPELAAMTVTVQTIMNSDSVVWRR